MQRGAIFAGVLLLSGCQSMMASDTPDPAQLSQAVNSRFAGGSLENVLARYGPPGGNFVIANGVEVFLWHANTTMRLHEPSTSTTTGRIGDNTYPSRSIPYTQTTTTRVGYDANFACTMQVGVNPKTAIVEAIGFDGKMGACKVFMP